MGRGIQRVVPHGNGAIVFLDAPVSQVVIAHPYDMGQLANGSSRTGPWGDCSEFLVLSNPGCNRGFPQLG
jgi:hypothetical protein